MDHPPGGGQRGHPYLQHQPDPDLPPVRISLDPLPFVIGRSPSADFVVHSRQISKEHAEIDRRRARFLVRDLGSRNGTFVNGARIEQPTPLAHGDLLHVATTEFVFGWDAQDSDSRTDSTIISEPEIQEAALRNSRDLFRILNERAVRPVFQPIVRMSDAGWVGYEALGRNALPGVDYSPIALFKLAANRGRADALSRLMREVALAEAPRLPGTEVRLFINLHPAEMRAEELHPSLATIPELLAPGQRAVIEIHEAAVTDPKAMAELRAHLRDLDIGLAYDDFGAGQSRLMELAEVPPDVIKLDKALVRDIDRSTPRQGLVQALVKVMVDMGVEVLAEGVETEGEAEVCRALGCTLGQGYLYCRPSPVDDLNGR